MKPQKIFSFIVIAFLIMSCSFINNLGETATPLPAVVVPTPTQSLNFSLDTGNKIPPNDVIQELGYIGGFGGGGVCYEKRSDPYIYGETEGSEDQFELMEMVHVILCNLTPNEEVDVEITLPDDTIQQDSAKSDETGTLTYSYVPTLDSPTGIYLFSFDVLGAYLEKNVTIVEPKEARLYVLGQNPDKPNEEKQIILYNFAPNEKVRLFAYEDGKFAFWREFIVDDVGMLTIQNQSDPGQFSYAVVGDSTGGVYEKRKGWGWNPYSEWVAGDVYCAGAPNPIRGIYPQADVVIVSDQAYVKYYELDSQGSYVSKKFFLPKGEKLKILGLSSPSCQDNAFWWTVDCKGVSNGAYCDQFASGWIAEQIGSDQFIQPINK